MSGIDEVGAEEAVEAAGTDVHASRWSVLTTVLLGLFAVNVTITILAVSIHGIAEEFDTAEATMTWVVTGPLLAFAVVGPLVGKLGDRIGHRRIFLWGIAGTILMAFASSLAWSAGSLIGFRTLSAIQGAATGPASFAIISRVFHRHDRVRALGYWSMVAAGAPVVGVVAGGPLVEAFGWRMIFVGQIPLAVIALGFAYRLLPETPKHTGGRFDLAGAALLALTVTPVLYALSESARLGWTDARILVALLLSPVALVGFVQVERRASNPLLPLRYLRVPGFSLALTTQALLNAAYMGSFILTPLYLQNVLGFTETRTGLISISRPLAFSVAGVFAGSIVARLGGRRSATAGAMFVAGAMAWMATFGEATPDLGIMGALALAGVGMGVAMPPLAGSVTVSVDDRDLGIAGAAQNMLMQVGVVFGIQVMQAVQQARVDVVGQTASYSWGYLAGLALAIVGVVSARWIAETGAARPDPASETPSVDPEVPEPGAVAAG